MTSFAHPMFERFSKFARPESVASLKALAMPNRKSEEFRFFDVKRISEHEWHPAGENIVDPTPFLLPEASGSTLVVRDGRIDLKSSSLHLPEGVFVGSLDQLPAAEQGAARDALGSAVVPYADDVFVQLNNATLADVSCVFLQKDVSLEATIHILYLGSGADTFNAPRLLVVAAAGSKATIVEDFRSEDTVFTNAVSEVVLAENANLHHVRVQREGVDARHVSRVGARVGRFAKYDSVHVSLGANSSRSDVWVSHEGEDGWSRIDGLAMVAGNAESDTHSVIDNTKVRCESHQLHKCIVDDRGHAVFNGKIMVRKGAQKINAYQLNRNLLLSARAKVDTKPQLEIFADDVVCSHGATVGQLDDDQLFYLLSRGLSAEQARSTLTYAFAAEVIESIAVPSLAATLEETAHQRTMRR